MENAIYNALTRQSGLRAEMDVVANNLANASTTGYRAQSAVFSEFVQDTGVGHPSLSMARFTAYRTDLDQGALRQTGGTFDLAIEGDGFFAVQTEFGTGLTRAGAFIPSVTGDLMTPDGYPLLDSGFAPVFVPPDATTITISADGTIAADGIPLGQIGLFAPQNANDLNRQHGTIFSVSGEAVAIEGSRILQGFVESSNVNPITEITRMIEVQRAYEMGQKILDQEHERIRNAMQTLTK